LPRASRLSQLSSLRNAARVIVDRYLALSAVAVHDHGIVAVVALYAN
jgi:hypothetical protein